MQLVAKNVEAEETLLGFFVAGRGAVRRVAAGTQCSLCSPIRNLSSALCVRRGAGDKVTVSPAPTRWVISSWVSIWVTVPAHPF
jgi:hypothetical protein